MIPQQKEMPSEYPTRDLIVYDLEVLNGFFMAGFMLPSGASYIYVAGPEGYKGEIHQFIDWATGNGLTLAGFNSRRYDDIVLTKFLETSNSLEAYRVSVDIIENDADPWGYRNKINSIDLMPLLPGRMSLKKVGVCLGHSKLQELPVDPHEYPQLEQQKVLFGYNQNDLEITRALQNEIQKALDLRGRMSDKYGVDLRSLGDATMAETILFSEYRNNGGALKKRELNEQGVKIAEETSSVEIKRPTWWDRISWDEYPEYRKVKLLGEKIFYNPVPLNYGRLSKGALDRIVFLGDRYYKMGVGGLHSIDGPGCWIPREDQVLVDIDVASYYPFIALTQNIAPRQWGDAFYPIYKDIVERRIKAKAEGDEDTAYTLKIAVNGTFGKSSDLYSCLYDPQMTVNITVLGQLGLLALIGMLEGFGYVVSANTDGISVLCETRNYGLVRRIVSEWENATGLTMEYTEYQGLYQRDVNNYVALTTKGKIKAKGRFINEWPDLRHTPNANIVATAIQNYIKHGTPFERTLFECKDINQFLLTQSVAKNWSTWWNERPLGNVLRFYKSNAQYAAPIIRTPDHTAKGNEGNVPDSENCVPLENIPLSIDPKRHPWMPEDLNYAWYLEETKKLWDVVSHRKTLGLNRWAELIASAGLRPCVVDPEAPLSRAGVTYGTTDFSSKHGAHVFGTSTGTALDGGKNLLAQVFDNLTLVYEVDQPLPSRSRKKIYKDHGFNLIYGARVPLNTPFYHVITGVPSTYWHQFYTESELNKIKG